VKRHKGSKAGFGQNTLGKKIARLYFAPPGTLTICNLEAFYKAVRKRCVTRGRGIRTTVDDAWTRLVVLLLGAPEVLERAEGGKDGSTDPDRVLALGRCDDLDLHARGRQRRELLLHTICDSGEHGRAAGEYDVAVQVTSDIEVTLEDRVVAVREESA
jgi:hypothetical protein